MKRRNLLAAGIASSALLAVSRAYAAWPERPISLIVPYPAGGGTDIVARTLAPLLEREIGGTINVLNRPGGGGITGHEAVARSTPDGYTLGMITNDLSFYVPLGQSNLTHRDFAKIGQTNEIAATVTVKPGSPYDTVPKLLAAIRANPGKLRGTGAASGVSWHVAYLGMMDSLGMDPKSAIWVPSQGGTLGHQDVAAGGSEFSTASIGEARALLEADKVKTLAIMSDARIAQFPNIPTLKEATGSGWNFSVAHGVAGPKGLPVPIQERLAAALVKVHASEEFQTQLKNRLIRAIHRTPAEWDAVLDRQLTDFSRLLRAAGLARG